MSVTPGATNTPGLREVYTNGRDLEESVARAAAQSPLGRIGGAGGRGGDDRVRLQRPRSLVTGAELLVEGGMTMSYAAD